MTLTQAQIAHIARLSRLELTPDQLEHFRSDIDSIVGYMDILDQIPQSELDRVSLPEGMILPLRADIVTPSDISRESLLSVSAQKKIAGAIALPNIMS